MQLDTFSFGSSALALQPCLVYQKQLCQLPVLKVYMNTLEYTNSSSGNLKRGEQNRHIPRATLSYSEHPSSEARCRLGPGRSCHPARLGTASRQTSAALSGLRTCLRRETIALVRQLIGITGYELYMFASEGQREERLLRSQCQGATFYQSHQDRAFEQIYTNAPANALRDGRFSKPGKCLGLLKLLPVLRSFSLKSWQVSLTAEQYFQFLPVLL